MDIFGVFMKTKPLHEDHQSQSLVKEVIMTTKHGRSYKSGGKATNSVHNNPYMKQDLHGFEEYEDLV